MKVSLSWLKSYVPLGSFEKDPASLAESLTMRGIEISSINEIKAPWTNVVVGQIKKIEKHPNADKLSLCVVTDGKENFQVVCGAQNIKEGDKAPFAKIGALLPGGFEIKKTNLRGIDSYGMLCSSKELAFGEEASGILILQKDVKVGAPFEKAIGYEDTTLECEVTPNRGDCLSHIGIAREVAAIRGVKLTLPKSHFKESQVSVQKITSVTIKHRECLRYAAIVLQNVKVKPSPLELQLKLRSIGLRPINNIVDITNFILMEYGQPLHAFDFDKLKGSKIIVRYPKEGEKIKSLDGETRILHKDDIVIADGEDAVALGGVIGGFDSQVTEETKNILIESASFNPATIRRTSKRLKVQTDSSYRFERGIDIEGVILALERAAALMCELGEGQAYKGKIDVYPKKQKKTTIVLEKINVDTLLGISFPEREVKKALSDLQFSLKPKGKNQWKVEVPSFRGDVSHEADLIEEIIRSIGFDKVPLATLPAPSKIKYEEPIAFKLKKHLSTKGFHETVSYSFVPRALLEKCHVKLDSLKLLNPLAEEFSCMRPALFPSLIAVLLYNLNRKANTVKIFELRNVFEVVENRKLPQESEHLALLLSGQKALVPWKEYHEYYDFFDLKGIVEGVLDHENNLHWKRGEEPWLHPGKSASLYNGHKKIGFVGELHPEVQHAFEMDQSVVIAELNFEKLLKRHKQEVNFKNISKYPLVARDLAVVLEETVSHEEVLQCIKGLKSNLIQSISLFDVYSDPQKIGEGKRSLAFRIFYQSYEKTLDQSDIEEAHNAIVQELSNKLGAQVRI